VKAVRAAPPEVRVVDIDEPEGDGELIRIRSASICASDFIYMELGSHEILGHELAGITADGEAVAIEGIFGCNECEWCRRGNYNLCARATLDVLGLTVKGGMSEYFRAPRHVLTPLPAGLSVEDGSLVEPTAVAWHSCRVGGVGPDTSVAVVGAGAIGLLAGVAAQAMGAPEVVIEARHPHQRQAAERFGLATPTEMYDVVIETGGSEGSLHRAVELARPQGTVVVVGVHGADVAWPHQLAFAKEVRTAPALGYCQTSHGREFGEAAGLLAARPEIAETLITHRLPIEDAEQAFRIAADRSAGTFRVVIDPS